MSNPVEQKETPKNHISLAITTNSRGEVLIISRTSKEKGTDNTTLSWAFPGGKVEEGEDFNVTSQRELLEETGFTAEVDKLISEREHPQFPVIVHYYHCVLEENIPQQEISEDEIEEVKWVNPQDLMNYFTTDLDPNVAEFLGLNN